MNKDTDTALKFDTVRFTTHTHNIVSANDSLFKVSTCLQTGEILTMEYLSHRNPDITYKLYISVNYRSERMTVEFSSKILLSDYPRSISESTFRQCLQNIESAGICKLNIDGIISDCYFSKLHIVRDVELELTDTILNILNQCVGNFRRYKWHRYNDGILFTNDTKSSDCKEALVIYNKEVEIALSKNRVFVDSAGDPDSILAHFRGKTRLEVQLDNKRKIAKELGIANTDYHSVMGCRKNMVLTQFNKIFTTESLGDRDANIHNFADYALWNIIRRHNFDLKSIEQEIKDMEIYSNKTKGARGKQMKKIKAMINASNGFGGQHSVIDDIRKLLK